ncbi:MAG: hypothetical protein HOQ45_02415 [Nocardioidaceae bacterium]|nr:hypothetical protein [Dermatophilaceae bacterium]NUR05848.1 hypothetical protein [Nocardioidaceae bacterium]NUR80034.1 hypothetical protein [Dermatophilaceae bacterium]
MKRFRYVGGSDAVDLAGVGTVERGHLVEVEDTEVSASLEQQPDVWEHVPDPKRSRAAKQAAETRGDNVKEA